MSRRGFSKNGLFLMELIFVILFFSIASAICLKMFVYASQAAEKAENLSYATLWARSAAECYQATGGDLAEVAELLGGTATQDELWVDFDDQWHSATDQGAQYQLTLTPQGTVASIVVVTTADVEPLYTLTVATWGGDAP